MNLVAAESQHQSRHELRELYHGTILRRAHWSLFYVVGVQANLQVYQCINSTFDVPFRICPNSLQPAK